MDKVIRSNGKKFSSTKIVFAILAVVLILYSTFMLLMLIWGLFTSLKSIDDFEYLGNVIGFPNLNSNEIFNSREAFFKFQNYATIINNFVIVRRAVFYRSGIAEPIVHVCEAGFGELLVNTVLYTVGGALIYALMPALTAYLCAKYDYKLSGALIAVYTLMMCMPIVGSAPFELTFLRNVGLYDSIWGNYIQKMTGGGMYFFVYLAFFKGLSDTYREAASIDGASEGRIMLSVYFPLALKIISTVFLIQFVALWNDYQTPLLYLPTHPTIGYAVYYISYESFNPEFYHTPVQVAGLMLLALPIIVLFVVFKEKLMGDISLGGIKE